MTELSVEVGRRLERAYLAVDRPEVKRVVKEALASAQAAATAVAAMRAVGPGGRYLRCQHHGEIPWQVSAAVLDAVAAAVHQHGRYPIAAARERDG